MGLKLFFTLLLQQLSVGVLQQLANGPCSKTTQYGFCEIKANPNIPSNITGVVYMHEKINSRCQTDFLNIQVKIENVPNDDGTILHGFHIHEFGDMSNGCESMGPHYNPLNATHGKLWTSMYTRHVGDLGNIRQRRKDGLINTRIVDYLATLDGEYSIYGRGLVVGRNHRRKPRDLPIPNIDVAYEEATGFPTMGPDVTSSLVLIFLSSFLIKFRI